MKVLLDFPDHKAPFLMDVLQHISYVKTTRLQDSETEEVKSEEKKPVFGCLKGKIWMSDDFDEPLEDFAEYM